MARPIAETPILTGADAKRFVERMNKIEQLSTSERAENTRKLKEAVKEARKIITVCI